MYTLCIRMVLILGLGKCDKCSKKAKIGLAYGKHNFCEDHFLYFFEKRVKKTMRINKLVGKHDSIAVGVSGGKDSIAAVTLLREILPKKNEIHAILIDEGIPNYREKAIKIGVKRCKELDVPYNIISLQDEFGYSMVDVVREMQKMDRKPSPCSYCGVFRRKILNKYSEEMNADKLATGHNLDDECQSICMNIFENDLPRLARLGALSGTKKIKGLVPRIKPLWTTPELEIPVYLQFREIEYYTDKCCPFRGEAKRNHFRAMLDDMEEKLPGTKYSIQASFKQLKPQLKVFEKTSSLHKCKNCGAISSSEECMSCKLISNLKKN